jgi:hypothetical protein
MALEALEGKILFSEGSVGIVGFLSGWKLWRERIGVLAKIGNFSGIFWWIFGVFGTYSQILFRTRGSCCNFFQQERTVVQFTTNSGASVQSS